MKVCSTPSTHSLTCGSQPAPSLSSSSRSFDARNKHRPVPQRWEVSHCPTFYCCMKLTGSKRPRPHDNAYIQHLCRQAWGRLTDLICVVEVWWTMWLSGACCCGFMVIPCLLLGGILRTSSGSKSASGHLFTFTVAS